MFIGLVLLLIILLPSLLLHRLPVMGGAGGGGGGGVYKYNVLEFISPFVTNSFLSTILKNNCKILQIFYRKTNQGNAMWLQ
jgi:hypothetical protein